MYRRAPRLAIFLIALTSVLALVAPMNFVLMTPGDPQPLFPKTLTIAPHHAETHSYKADGQMYLLTIYVTNPETKVLGAEVLGCWVWGRCAVVPRSAIYQRETDNEKEIATGTKEMKQSQSAALTVARRIIAQRFPQVDLTQVTDSAIKVNLKDTGGPSGGLIFTLGLIELLTPDNLLQGRSIAATGTMNTQGHVGAIGGVSEKVLGAKSAKAAVIFVPRENCSDLPDSVSGISVVAVNSVDQAITYLLASSQGDSRRERILNSAGIHGCANLGA